MGIRYSCYSLSFGRSPALRPLSDDPVQRGHIYYTARGEYVESLSDAELDALGARLVSGADELREARLARWRQRLAVKRWNRRRGRILSKLHAQLRTASNPRDIRALKLQLKEIGALTAARAEAALRDLDEMHELEELIAAGRVAAKRSDTARSNAAIRRFARRLRLPTWLPRLNLRIEPELLVEASWTELRDIPDPPIAQKVTGGKKVIPQRAPDFWLKSPRQARSDLREYLANRM